MNKLTTPKICPTVSIFVQSLLLRVVAIQKKLLIHMDIVGVVNLASHRVFLPISFKPEVLWFVLENTLGKTVSEGILGQEIYDSCYKTFTSKTHDHRGRL